MKYRKFKLLNGLGNTFTLTEHNLRVFANNPQGLGYSRTMSLLRLGDDYIVPYQIINLDQIDLEILFYDDTNVDKYQKYNDFVNFLSHKPIYLQYQKPNSFTWYRRKVEVMQLTKTEVNRDDSILHCPMTLQTLGFWEDNDSRIIDTNNNTSDGKIYPITYPIKYGATSLSNIPIISEGLLDTPLEITVNGTVTDLQYILYDESNIPYGRGKINGTYDRIYINSDEANEEIQLIRGGLIIDNPLYYQDLTIGSPNEINITFLKLKTGISKLSFVVDLGFTGDIRVEWRNRYVTI